jgi:hypothetical protein
VEVVGVVAELTVSLEAAVEVVEAIHQVVLVLEEPLHLDKDLQVVLDINNLLMVLVEEAEAQVQ